MKKRGLGARGLEALLSDIKKEQVSTDDSVLMDIAVDKLRRGKYQPRREMDEVALRELSESIARHGVMQPIVIRALPKSEQQGLVTHEIIAGERRWRAAKLAGKSTIPAIHRVLSDELAIALALIENIQREDLSVLEQAQALQRFHSDFGMSHAMIAEVVGKARTTVSNLLRLNALNDTVKEEMNKGRLDMGHARSLLSLPHAQQALVAKKIVAQNMTVREAERLVKSILQPAQTALRPKDKALELLSQKLSDKLGAPIKLKQSKQGGGVMEIFFKSNEELSSLLSQLDIEG